MEEKHTSKIDIKELLAKFELNNIVYNSEAYSDFKNFNDETLMTWLLNLEDIIKLNFEQKTYTKNIKDNLYKILSIYRERFKDINVLNKINELITMLNKSSETNAYKMLKYEFDTRYIEIVEKNLARMAKLFNMAEMEEYVTVSICTDYEFLKSLTSEAKDKFLDRAIGNFDYLTSLNYLITLYGHILSDIELLDKIFDLLKCNMEISKYLRKRGLEQDGNLEDVYYESKVCLKKIKKIQKGGL